jgi:hypothetical protein
VQVAANAACDPLHTSSECQGQTACLAQGSLASSVCVAYGSEMPTSESHHQRLFFPRAAATEAPGSRHAEYDLAARAARRHSARGLVPDGVA